MNLRPLLFIPPIALGIAGYIWLTTPDPELEAQSVVETVTPVRTLTLAETSIVPFAVGYGRVEAEDTWSAISQVEGRTVFVADDLDVGRVLSEGTEIVRIDPRDYEIALARATAARDSALASLEELEATEANTRSTIELETRIEDVLRGELERQQTLLERGSVPQATVDASVRALLAQEKVVLNLENSLRLLPAQRTSLEATIATRTVEIEEAERALANTAVSIPLTGRVIERGVSFGQYIRTGDTLVSIESTASSEVVAEFQTRVLGNFFGSLEGTIDRNAIVGMEAGDAFEILRQFGLSAEVRVTSGAEVTTWPAELVRFDGSADATTGTVGLVVRVDEPTQPSLQRPGPPLINGTFVEVRLIAAEALPAIRVPRDAIRQDKGEIFVYVADQSDQLARRPVVTGAVQDDQVTIAEGLSSGDRVVLSDPRPAIIGMSLEPLYVDRE
ncbi:hypothetical protein SLH49_18815 [Cognatiyoonia sp. IB215446]|uniref:efflux RND transporter periplasmic adaptor subunit n=1 Tax=Cognatiyoonia sp. IB215446 TaxID=3097355 RepID=UPI002A0C0DA3|nr:hypothetical protein [Cognatiyoonia sp. IB215446]MDX8350047.1 hypothetical protein [Cognatiyoonia sp. IB215446]